MLNSIYHKNQKKTRNRNCHFIKSSILILTSKPVVARDGKGYNRLVIAHHVGGGYHPNLIILNL